MSLPVPRILAALVTAEIAIADQVRAAESFKVELARTLIQDLVQRIAVHCGGMGTLAEGIDVVCPCSCSRTPIDAGVSLGGDKVSLCCAHQEEVRVRELRVVGRATACIRIAVLADRIARGEFRRGAHHELTVDAVEQRTVVTRSHGHVLDRQLRSVPFGEELGNELAAGAVSCPELTAAVVLLSVHVGLPGRSHQEERRTPGRRLYTVLKDRKNGLYRSTVTAVVAHKEHLVGTPAVGTASPQLMRAVDHFLGIFLGFIPAGCSRIDFSIQVHTRQQQVRRVLVCTSITAVSILAAGRLHQLALHLKQLTLNPLEQLSPLYLLRRSRHQRRGERHIAEAVHQVVIVERTQEPDLCLPCRVSPGAHL